MDCLKRTFLLLIFFCFLIGTRSLASETNFQIADSVQLGEIIVTGSMPKVNLKNLPMSITVVGEKQIGERLQPSVLPLLTEEVPGLFITQRGVMGYGVAAGAAGGMSIRGIGANPAPGGSGPTTGVLILIDGHPQYMGLMGHPLADSYQSMMTERIEVVSGPASVLYGSNAMGGVINIITKKQRKNGVNASFQSLYGSYNTFNAEASAGMKKNKLNGNINLGYNRSDGHRENMDFEQYSGYGKVGYDISKYWKTFVDLNIAKTFASNPGTVTTPIIDNDADVLRGMTSITLENEYEKTSGAWKFFYNFGKHKINDGYRAGGIPPVLRFNSNDYMLGTSAYQSYRFFEGNRTTAGIDFQRFGGKAWNQFPDNKVELVDISINDIAGYINVQQTVWENKLTLNAGIRYDYNEHSGAEWIPQVGISYLPLNSTVLKAIVSKGYRNPTIREMYMFPPQNPDLKPERLMNYEISLLQYFLENRLNLGLNLFHIQGTNMIQTVFTGGKPLNVNTWKVKNSGFELSSTYRVNENIRLSANYSFLHMEYKVIAAPEHKLYIGGSYTLDRWSFSTGLQYINGLYTSIGQTPTKENFTLWNARLNFKPSHIVNIFVTGENLLGSSYEINKGYPMPKATVFGGFQIHI